MKPCGYINKSRAFLSLILIFLTAAVVAQKLLPAAAGTLPDPVPAPEFTHDRDSEWINSKPLKLADMRGNVVLVDFWTFDCWNCYRSFPWLTSMENRMAADGLRVIGVHTPEFDHEKIRSNITAKVKHFDLKHPVMIDNDYSYWNAMGNRYWPAFYLIDKGGRVRAVYYGETHAGDRQAEVIEKVIRQLLYESI